MITPFEIYLINLADTLNGLFGGFAFITFILCVAIICARCNIDEPYDNGIKQLPYTDEEIKRIARLKKRAIKMGFVFIVFSSLSFLTPSTKTCYQMLIIPKIVNSQLAQNMPTYLQQYIEKQLSDK
jgi:hypothetical protein